MPFRVIVSDVFISSVGNVPVFDCSPLFDLIQTGVEAFHLVWCPCFPSLF